MLVKTILTGAELKEEFKKFDRDYYSYDACNKMVELFEMFDEPQELDIIGLCVDFNEESPEYIIDNYSSIEEFKNCIDEDGEIDIDALIDALNYYTYAVKTEEDGKTYILYMAF